MSRFFRPSPRSDDAQVSMHRKQKGGELQFGLGAHLREFLRVFTSWSQAHHRKEKSHRRKFSRLVKFTRWLAAISCSCVPRERSRHVSPIFIFSDLMAEIAWSKIHRHRRSCQLGNGSAETILFASIADRASEIKLITFFFWSCLLAWMLPSSKGDSGIAVGEQ